MLPHCQRLAELALGFMSYIPEEAAMYALRHDIAISVPVRPLNTAAVAIGAGDRL